MRLLVIIQDTLAYRLRHSLIAVTEGFIKGTGEEKEVC